MNGEPGGLKTKIVCTIGPASRDEGTITRMIQAGMDVARINTGHADLEEVTDYVGLLRRAGESAGKRVAVMLDLQGPRLRVGPIKGSEALLRPGQRFVVTTEQKRGDENRVSVAYERLTEDLKPGESILVDDGLIRMEVEEVSERDVRCRVVEGGRLVQGKGMNFPDSELKMASFTERDRKFLEEGLKAGANWVSQSFVRSAEDARLVKDAISDLGYKIPLMAKIEKAEAVHNIDGILEVVDGVMIARGDLGVEMEPEEVPLVQKELIGKSLMAALPVVTATQMLESMVERPRPSRAEASDVANAILDGTDAVMLSAETAIGAYPVKAVEMMSRIAARAESSIDYSSLLETRWCWSQTETADAIGYAACKIAMDLGAAAVITITRTGYTARMVSRYRPSEKILVASPCREVVDMVSVMWGSKGLVVSIEENLDRTIRIVAEACVDRGFVSRGELVVITGGFLDEKTGTTNVVHVHTVE